MPPKFFGSLWGLATMYAVCIGVGLVFAWLFAGLFGVALVSSGAGLAWVWV